MTHVMILAAISCGKSKSDRDHPKIIPAVHGSLTDRRGEFRDTFLILAKKVPKVRFHPGIPGRKGYADGKNNSRRIVAAGRQCRSAALPPYGIAALRQGGKEERHTKTQRARRRRGRRTFCRSCPWTRRSPRPGTCGTSRKRWQTRTLRQRPPMKRRMSMASARYPRSLSGR